jgi:hypothetical protein
MARLERAASEAKGAADLVEVPGEVDQHHGVKAEPERLPAGPAEREVGIRSYSTCG